jgi:hypothetical protein
MARTLRHSSAIRGICTPELRRVQPAGFPVSIHRLVIGQHPRQRQVVIPFAGLPDETEWVRGSVASENSQRRVAKAVDRNMNG